MKKLLFFALFLISCQVFGQSGTFITTNTVYCMEGGVTNSISPADATTYYFGYAEGGTTAFHTTITNSQMTVPMTGKITRVQWQIMITGVNGSSESVSHFIRVNNTTDTTLSTSETYDQGANTSKAFTYTGLSIAVVAGDTIAFKMVAPTWATNPTSIIAHLLIFIETR